VRGVRVRGGRWESGRVGEWESGRVGEWESGRVGEWESGRVEGRKEVGGAKGERKGVCVCVRVCACVRVCVCVCTELIGFAIDVRGYDGGRCIDTKSVREMERRACCGGEVSTKNDRMIQLIQLIAMDHHLTFTSSPGLPLPPHPVHTRRTHRYPSYSHLSRSGGSDLPEI
jgi:hypothetical protein